MLNAQATEWLAHFWFLCVGDQGGNTGMWIVELDMSDDGETVISIIHLNTVIQASHLLPVFSEEHISKTLSFTDTFNTFTRFYVNKYADHAFKIAFWFCLDHAWGAYVHIYLISLVSNAEAKLLHSLDKPVYLSCLTCFRCLFTPLHHLAYLQHA